MNGYIIDQSSGIHWERPHLIPGCAYPDWEQVPPDRTFESTGWERSRRLLHQYQQIVAEFAATRERELNLVRRDYILEDSQSVEDRLESHPALADLLLEAAPLLKEYFGADAQIALRVRIDESGAQTLQSIVRWKGSLRDATAALERFDESWWLENCHRAFGNIVFDYELT